MDLVYSVTRHEASVKKWPEWLQEGSTMVKVSSRNTLLFTSSTLLSPSHPESPLTTWGCHLYCADLNTPWEPVLVTSTDCAVVSLAWDTHGHRFIMADMSGVVSVWEMEEQCITEWKVIATNKYNHEKFVAANFFARSKPISINSDHKDSVLYSEKFSSGSDPMWSRSSVDGCVLLSSSGLLVTVAFTSDQEPVWHSSSVGLGRRRVTMGDIGTTGTGQCLVATVGVGCSVHVYSVLPGWDAGAQLCVRTHSHSSFSLRQNDDRTAVTCLQFMASAESLVVAMSGEDGNSSVQVWDLKFSPRTIHKALSTVTPAKQRSIPGWVLSEEMSCGVSTVTSVSSPSCLGADGHICVCYNDASVQLVTREGLSQLAGAELPRDATLCSAAFTAAAGCLVVGDSLGQLYLYRLSVPHLVTMLEYCLVTGTDSWDLTIAADNTMLEAAAEKLSQNFSRQSVGQQQYYNSRFMAVKSTLYRLTAASQYKAGDTTAVLMLQAVNSALKGLLRCDSQQWDTMDPGDKLDMALKTQEDAEIETGVQLLLKAGMSRDHGQDASTGQFLNQLSLWVTTLCLHVLAAVPEFKSRKGPGYTLVHDGQSLTLLRELLVIFRLWSLNRVSIICTEKEMDLVGRLYSMVTRLIRKADDEALMDECLMLPHKVMIPPLDTILRSQGVLSCLQHLRGSPSQTFTFGTEPDLPSNYQPPFIEGLTYTDDPHSDFYYDSIQKIYLGHSPSNLKHCSRCAAVSQVCMSKSSLAKLWDSMWGDRCLCGGSWKMTKD